jgi:hypothetical protein
LKKGTSSLFLEVRLIVKKLCPNFRHFSFLRFRQFCDLYKLPVSILCSYSFLISSAFVHYWVNFSVEPSKSISRNFSQNISHNNTLNRSPASSHINDDAIDEIIIVKSEILPWHGETAEDKKNIFYTREMIRYWTEQREMAQNYGLEDRLSGSIPTIGEQQAFVQRNYLRFLSQRVERNTQQTAQSAFNNWTLNDEIDAVKNFEKHEEYIIKAKKTKGIHKENDKEKKIKIASDEIKFFFQPRLEMGMVRMRVFNERFSLMAWLGINGNQELQFDHQVPVINAHFMSRYYLDEGRTLTAFDQPLKSGKDYLLSLRLSHDYFNQLPQNNELGLIPKENTMLQIRFGMTF